MNCLFKNIIMKIINIPIICITIAFLGFCFLFKDSLSKRILESNCTEFKFYEASLNICNNNNIEKLEMERDSISRVVTNLRSDYLEMADTNMELTSIVNELRKASKTTQAQSNQINKIVNATKKIKVGYDGMSPQIERYSRYKNSNR